MTWTGRVVHSNATDTLYAKSEALTGTPSWGSDVVAGGQNATYLKQYTFSPLSDNTRYIIFRQSGGSPSSGDIALYEIDDSVGSAKAISDAVADVATDAATAAAEVVKIPRSATTLTAGGSSRWTNVGTAANRDDITIGPST